MPKKGLWLVVSMVRTGRHFVPAPVEGEQRNAQGQGPEEDEFGDDSGDACNTRKAKSAECQRSDEKSECVINNDEPLWQGRVFTTL